MAKTFKAGETSGRKSNSKNKRYAVTFKFSGKSVTTAGFMAGSEQAAARYVERTMTNLGLPLPAGTELSASEVNAR